MFYLALCCGGDYRQLTKHSGHRRSAFYLAPCRRRLRNESEVDQYLVITDSKLTIDLFCFDADLRVDVEFLCREVEVRTETAGNTAGFIYY